MPAFHPAHDPQPAPPPPTGDGDAHRIRGAVLAGVVPGQPPAVVRRAAELAYSLGVELVLAHVDVTRVQTGAAGTSAPIDPDGVEEESDGTGNLLRSVFAKELAHYDLRWSFVQLAGEPAKALGQLAARVHASFIVVGTRERGVGARIEEILTGSVSVHLAHRQGCPVLVVPLGPHSATGDA